MCHVRKKSTTLFSAFRKKTQRHGTDRFAMIVTLGPIGLISFIVTAKEF